ncbi:MAG TPA: hypothetical protein VLS92_05625 [Acidimicrobiia bacterium]|nr:hypothetical protein [Acidimicrobiia bacterium]
MRRSVILALVVFLAAALVVPAAAAGDPRAGGTIRGTITDTAGLPLPIAAQQQLSAEAFDTATGDHYQTRSSDPQGSYQLSDLPAGTYKLRFRYLEADGDLLRYRWYDDQATFDTATPVTLGDGSTLTINTALGVLQGAHVKGVFLSAPPNAGAIASSPCYGVEIFEASGISIGTVGPVVETGKWVSAGLVPAGEMTAVARWDPNAPRCPDVLPHLWKWYQGPSGGNAYATNLAAVPRLLAAAGTFEVPATGILASVNFKLTPTPTCPSLYGRTPTMIGTTLPDVIVGTSDDDVIVGLTGNDRIFGLAGNDMICGNLGDDILKGGAGRDFLLGGDGLDQAFGGAGRLDNCNAETRRGCELGVRGS